MARATEADDEERAIEHLMRFRERDAFAFVAAALIVSSFVHFAIAETAHVTSVELTPASPTCKVGEIVQLEAFAHTLGRLHPKVTNVVTWGTTNDSIAIPEGGGWVRCVQEGSASITASIANRVTSVQLVVLPTLIMVDVKEEPPPPEPEPEPMPEEPAPQPKVATPTPTARPEAAKAGQLLTAPDDRPSQTNDDTMRFASDENGNEYGSGLVAKGGTADSAGRTAKVGGPPAGGGSASSKGLGLAPPAPVTGPDLSRKATFVEADPCRGFFPNDADDDAATVTVRFTVRADGSVASVTVLDENPRGQGFGRQARACLTNKHLSPALDHEGTPIEVSMNRTIKFTR